MGVTSSSRSGRGCHFDPSWYDGRFNEYGNLQVRSKRVSAFFGVHHFFRFEVLRSDLTNGSDADSKWVVFEWMDDGKKFYACDGLWSNHCIDLGNYYLKDVYKAAAEASDGRSWSKDYNCNIWTETVARKLGRNITVHWNCSCVL